MIDDLECYLVGGAVRDALLGRETGDRDWVVVGATPRQMLDLGFTQVGRDFPVYLHPETHEEYALARTERKQGHGHRGFVVNADPSVTLEQDLQRRDLTINAIARDDSGVLIDPFGGEADLNERVLRHVSAAFGEDPLRVFRVARFAAQLPEFEVAQETLALMRDMAADGELRALSAERVWQELEKALSAPSPERFFLVLDETGCLTDWFAELKGVQLDFRTSSAELRFAELPLDAPGFKALAGRLKAPRLYLQTALDWLQWKDVMGNWKNASAQTLCDGFQYLKVAQELNRLERVAALLAAWRAMQVAPLLELAAQWSRVKVDSGSGQPPQGPAYGEALRRARLAFIERARASVLN